MKATLFTLILSVASMAATLTARADDSASSEPVVLSATDLVTKVYGVVDPALPAEDAMTEAERCLSIDPTSEDGGFWLDSEDGYVVNYSGMTPEVSAVAQYDKSGINDYCYFFIFPYTPSSQEAANRQQCAFCGALLQEMNDFASMMGVVTANDALFQAVGSYDGSQINVRLTDETNDDASGRYVLMVDITPNASTSADGSLADLITE